VVDFPENVLYEIGPKNEKRYTFNLKNETFEICMISDIGIRRTNNEDHCIFSKPDNNDYHERLGILTAVADGMGGAVAGEHASKMAVTLLSDYYYKSEGNDIPKILLNSIQKINEDIFNLSEKDSSYFGMGTTLSTLVMHGDTGYVAQVGDSRVYIYRQEYPVKQVTEDHSIVAEQLKEGLINEEEARNHMLKNLITRALGIKETVEIDLYAFVIKAGDTILLCSDGLSNMITEKQLQQGLSCENLIEGLNFLLDTAIDAGAPDNITAVAVRIIGPLEHKKLISHEGMTIVTPEKKLSILQKILSYFSYK